MIQVGIIGCGRIGRVHGECITHHVPEAVVWAVADPQMDEETQKWAAGLGIQKTCADYHELLDDPAIDAVLICSPTDTHAQISIEAAQAGKHIFCEKPVDHDIGRIQTVSDAVAKAGVKFQVGFNRRFDENFKAIHEAVSTGQIGEPQIICITSRDPEPPSPAYVKASGGMFLDMTIHDFDMVRYLSGSEATEVYASGAALIDPEIGRAGDIDTAVITLRMANGAFVTINNSRKAAYGYDQRAEVFGSKGAVSVSNNTLSKVVISTAEGVCSEKPLYFFLERYMQSFRDEIKAFITAITTDTETLVGTQDGLASVIIALAATKSLQENRAVRIQEIFE